jgi:hypothetical protein
VITTAELYFWEMTVATKSKKPILIGVAVLLLMACMYLYFTFSGWTYSEGSRAGVVVKLSHKGNWTKTWEGELSMGALDQGGVREKWAFSVLEGPQVEAVQDAMDHGKRVKLEYREQRGLQSWNGATKYFITGVEKVGD